MERVAGDSTRELPNIILFVAIRGGKGNMAKYQGQDLQKLDARADVDVAAIEEAGGPIAFTMDYVKYVHALRYEEDQRSVALAGKKFRRRAVQMAAVTAVLDVVAMSKWDEAKATSMESASHDLRAAARFAYTTAAGHFDKDALISLPEPTPEAESRRRKAARDWDRLIDTNPNSLVSIALLGHELHAGPSRKEIIRLLSLLGILAAIVILAFYIWSKN